MPDSASHFTLDLDFDPDDLAANSRGELSSAQRDFLKRKQRGTVVIPVVILIVMVILLASQPGLHIQVSTTMWVVVAAAVAFMVWNTYRGWWSYQRDLSDRVAAVEGSHSTRRIADDRGSYVPLSIGDKTFRVTRNTYGMFPRGHYRVYYVPHSMTLLSMEKLDVDPAKSSESKEQDV